MNPMKPPHMRNLTLASAKHLLSQGHINQATHDKIVAASGIPSMPKMPTMPKGTFGSLAKKMQAAAPPPMMQGPAPPPPGLPGGPPALPPTMNSLYQQPQ